jgi:hypothetical protein
MLAPPLGACNKTAVGSDTVRTKGIWASMEVKSTGPSTTLTAQLFVGSGTGTPIFPLVAPDDLRVSIGGGAEQSLTETCKLDQAFCTGNLGDIGGEKVVVNFDRGQAAENAPNSNVVMPEAFEVSVDDDEVVRGVDDIDLDISGSSKSLRYKVSGSCIWSEDGFVTDGAIPASAITSPASEVDEDCEIEVVITRSVEGTVDPAFGKGGKIVAVQERAFTVFSLAKADTPDPSTSSGATSSAVTGSSTSETASATAPGDAGPDASDVSSATEEPDASTTGADTASDTGSQASSGTDSSSAVGSSTAVDTSTGPESTAPDAGDAG